MRITKNTTDIPNERLRELIRLACKGINTTGVILDVRNSSNVSATGRIWSAGRGWMGWYRKWVRARVVISLPRKEPCNIYIRRHGKGIITLMGQTREAAFVKILAHEIYHHRQRQQHKHFAQAACDSFAFKKLLESKLLPEGETPKAEKT